MKSFAFAALAAAAQAVTMTALDYNYMMYVSEHNKFYDTVEEFDMRKELYRIQDDIINELNDNDGDYRAAHQFFSDWTEEEKYPLFNGEPEDMDEENLDLEVYFVDDETYESESNGAINWCSKGKCTKVRSQGHCGSCWAFAGSEVMESAYAIKHGSSPSYLSPQQLIDCVKDCHGCDGGSTTTGLNWYKSHKGASDKDYPYKGSQGSCKSVSGKVNASSVGQVSGNTSSIKSAIEKGPVKFAVASSSSVFHNYSSGIIKDDGKCSTSTNHAIQAVGWGSDSGKDYYIVRNSWGTGWGQSGFGKLAVSSSSAGTCGCHKKVIKATAV